MSAQRGADPLSAGLPAEVSLHDNLHGAGFAMAIVAWVLLLVVLARWPIRHDRTAWAQANVVLDLALVVTAACVMTPFGTVLAVRGAHVHTRSQRLALISQSLWPQSAGVPTWTPSRCSRAADFRPALAPEAEESAS